MTLKSAAAKMRAKERDSGRVRIPSAAYKQREAERHARNSRNYDGHEAIGAREQPIFLARLAAEKLAKEHRRLRRAEQLERDASPEPADAPPHVVVRRRRGPTYSTKASRRLKRSGAALCTAAHIPSSPVGD
jgi:hypothetical protein